MSLDNNGFDLSPKRTRQREFLDEMNRVVPSSDLTKLSEPHYRSKGSMLRAGPVVDATLIAAPSSSKNADGERNPEMHQTKKGNQWYFGMRLTSRLRGVGFGTTVVGTAAKFSNVMLGNALLPGDKTDAFGDAGYQGVARRDGAPDVTCTLPCDRANAGRWA